MSDNALLDIKGISKSFGGLKALDDIDLEVKEGSIHAIIGPNGAGKSTFLNCVIGLIPPDVGSVTFAGQPLGGLTPHAVIQRGIARVFQTPQIFPGMSLRENVALAALAKIKGEFAVDPHDTLTDEHEAITAAEKILQSIGLIDFRHQEAAHLSRGDKRRLELGICLASRPRLLLLDEPTAGMSRHDTNRTIDLLKEISQTGMTKIIIEHDMHVVFSLAERITVLAQGAVIADGKPEEVRGNPKVREAYLGGSH